MKTSYITNIYETRTTDVEGVGAIREFGNKRYKWVLLSIGAGTPAVGTALGYVSSGFNGTTVSGDVSTCVAGYLAGLVQNNTSVDVPADAEYFWMQIGGIAALAASPTGTTPAVADAISLSATDDKTKVDPPVTEAKGGVLYNVTTTFDVYLRCDD